MTELSPDTARTGHSAYVPYVDEDGFTVNGPVTAYQVDLMIVRELIPTPGSPWSVAARNVLQVLRECGPGTFQDITRTTLHPAWMVARVLARLVAAGKVTRHEGKWSLWLAN